MGDRVSILAHPEGRALPPQYKQDAIADDVSILAHPEGRALLAGCIAGDAQEAVSILAHPEGRALQLARANNEGFLRFQSSPIPKDGRYLVRMNKFKKEVRVSILAHPEGRALRGVLPIWMILQ